MNQNGVLIRFSRKATLDLCVKALCVKVGQWDMQLCRDVRDDSVGFVDGFVPTSPKLGPYSESACNLPLCIA